jgi:hypothetical protein
MEGATGGREQRRGKVPRRHRSSRQERRRRTCLAHNGRTSTQWHTIAAQRPRKRPKTGSFFSICRSHRQVSEGQENIDVKKVFTRSTSRTMVAQMRLLPESAMAVARVGIASAARQRWIFFLQDDLGKARGRSAGLSGCGAARSRSHRLSLALPWQPAGSWAVSAFNRTRAPASVAGALMKEQWRPAIAKTFGVGVAALQIWGSLEL